MKRTPVTSSTLSSVGYDAKKHILELQFTSGEVYQYSKVPESRHSGLMNASSKGSYFNLFIKDKYSYEKIS